MSTNYYAIVTMAETVMLKLHIGSSHGPGGLGTVSGTMFPTIEAWKSFLKHNRDKLTIEDEYGSYWRVDDFIEEALTKPNTRQQEWLQANGYTVESGVPENWSETWWIDEASGFLFLGGFFA